LNEFRGITDHESLDNVCEEDFRVVLTSEVVDETGFRMRKMMSEFSPHPRPYIKHGDDDARGITESLLELIRKTGQTALFSFIGRPPQPASATSKHCRGTGYTGVFGFPGEKEFGAISDDDGWIA